MGHETRIYEYDGKLSKKEVINRFLEFNSDDCDCDFPRISEKSFKDCYLTGNTPEEVRNNFNNILSKRYFESDTVSIALAELHDEQKALKSKGYQTLTAKIQAARNEIKEINFQGFQKTKEAKTKKCPHCGAIHPTEKLRTERCPTCNKSLLGKGIDSKILKLNEKITNLELKQKEIILKQKKVKVWMVGIEFHV